MEITQDRALSLVLPVFVFFVVGDEVQGSWRQVFMRLLRGPGGAPGIPWGSSHLLSAFGHVQQSHLFHFGFRGLSCGPSWEISNSLWISVRSHAFASALGFQRFVTVLPRLLARWVGLS